MRALPGIVAALAFVFVAACSGGGGGDAKSEAGLEKAVRRAAEGIVEALARPPLAEAASGAKGPS